MAMNLPSIAEFNPVRIVKAIRDLASGRSNATGTFSLATSGTTTAVTAPNCGTSSVPLIMPSNAAAAGDIAQIYVSAVTQGSFTVTHPVNASARTFRYAILG